MSTFVLMELCKQSGVKNVIYQLLAPSITLNLDEVEENRKHPTPILAVWTISATFAPC